jgi:hypothetical protein
MALRAVFRATELTPRGVGMSVGVLVAYIQATAADLLRAIGMDRGPAHETVGRAAEAAIR